MELSKKAMLVSVNIKLEGLLGERRDKAASEMVSTAYSANAKRTKTAKYLIDRQSPKVKAVIAAAQRVRETVYKYSFPWGDTKLRMLPVKVYETFKSKVDVDLADLRDAQDEYIRVYPDLVKDSKEKLSGLGGLYDQSQYPRPDQLKSMFHSAVEYWPIPNGGNFVAEIAQEAADDARTALIAANDARANEAVNDLVNRVEKTISTYVDKLSTYRETDNGLVGIFRDSLVSNVEEIGQLIRSLNFSDLVEIDGLANQVLRLARYTADLLRENKDIRGTMVNEGRALIARLDSYRKVDSEVANIIGAVGDYM